MKDLGLERMNSPIGKILIITENKMLHGLEFEDYEARTMGFLRKRFGEFKLNSIQNFSAITQSIQAYLEGDYHSLEQIPSEYRRHGLSAAGLDSPTQHSGWDCNDLRRAGSKSGQTRSGSCGRHHQLAQPDFDCAALPPGNWCKRNAHRLRRRARAQALAASA